MCILNCLLQSSNLGIQTDDNTTVNPPDIPPNIPDVSTDYDPEEDAQLDTDLEVDESNEKDEDPSWAPPDKEIDEIRK